MWPMSVNGQNIDIERLINLDLKGVCYQRTQNELVLMRRKQLVIYVAFLKSLIQYIIVEKYTSL